MNFVDVNEEMNYVIRGARVMRMEKRDIMRQAIRLCEILDLKNCAAKGQPIIQALECSLPTNHGFPLNIDPIEDEEWILDTVEAMCDPESLTICMPNRLYVSAAQNEPAALQILFHELGHVFLVHKAMLHYSSSEKKVKEEDSEWQADVFAEAMMNQIFHKENPIQQKLF